MVTFDEELSRELASAESDEDRCVEDVADWYATLICQGFRSQDEDVEVLVEKIEEHWPDFQEVEGIEIHRLAREKHGFE